MDGAGGAPAGYLDGQVSPTRNSRPMQISTAPQTRPEKRKSKLPARTRTATIRKKAPAMMRRSTLALRPMGTPGPPYGGTPSMAGIRTQAAM